MPPAAAGTALMAGTAVTALADAGHGLALVLDESVANAATASKCWGGGSCALVLVTEVALFALGRANCCARGEASTAGAACALALPPDAVWASELELMLDVKQVLQVVRDVADIVSVLPSSVQFSSSEVWDDIVYLICQMCRTN